MTGNIVGEPFDDFVKNQIDIRQQNQFGGYDNLRTPNQLQYLTNRNAWVKLASSVNILPPIERATLSRAEALTQTNTEAKVKKLTNIGLDTNSFSGTQLAEKAVLFNTLSTYIPASGSLDSSRARISNTSNLWNDSFAYGIGGADYGIQAPPGIIGVTIDSLNRGSIRKATVTLKAHNKFQFDIIELLYLRLGFTMMLEWGWDKYINNKNEIEQVRNTIIEDQWFKTKGTSQLQMLGFIQSMRQKYEGNYDGFFGKVSNFTWNFNPDGTYDISIDLITLGDVIESLKVNLPIKNLFSLLETNEGVTKINFGTESKPTKLFDTNISKVATLNTLGYFLYTKIKELSNNFYYDVDKNSLDYISFPTKNTSSFKNPQYYIRLYELLTQLEEKIIPKIQNDGVNPESQVSFEKFGCLISYFPNQIPLDPRVCIFKPSLNSYGDITGIQPPFYFNNPKMAPYIISNDRGNFGLLMNLYINFEFVSGLLLSNGSPDQDLYLFKFLKDLCDGINNALGGVNKLEPVIKDDYKVTIIDQTLSLFGENDVNLEVYGYNTDNKTSNFIKDIKFVSKITPQLASMISIGATAAGSTVSGIDGTAFSKWSEGLQDRFALEVLEPKGNNISPDPKSIEKYKEIFEEFDYADINDRGIFGRAGQIFIAKLGNFLNPGGESTVALKNLEKGEENKKRIIKNNPFYGKLEGLSMTFSEFYERASEIDRIKAQENIKKLDEVNELVSTDYATYLAYAFGGISDTIKVEYQNFTENISGTGFSTDKIYQNSTTIKNLQVNIDESRYLEFDDTFISQGKSAYKVYINSLNNSRYRADFDPSSEIGFIPLSFDIILDGISGIKIYQKLGINNQFLPSNYPESLNFIITKVNHRIENNSWDTSISTISMPKTKPYKFNSSPSQTESSNLTGPRPDNNKNFIIKDKRKGNEIISLETLLKELNPIAQSSFKKFFEILQRDYRGYQAIINDVSRTWEDSYNFYNQDKRNAKPGRSLHSYGLAIDMNIITPEGTLLKKSTKQLWLNEKIDKVAADSKLGWGGNIQGYEDCVHFNYFYNVDNAYTTTLTQAKEFGVNITEPLSLDSIRKIDDLIEKNRIRL
jgi:hypothetical protein